MHPFEIAFETPKLIPTFPGWAQTPDESGYVWFDASLEIRGVVQEGLVFHGGCEIGSPDRHVTFELRALNPEGGRKIPLHRIDWRANSGGHSNRIRPKDDAGNFLAPARASESHMHPFSLNWVPQNGRMRKGLPVAIDIPEEIQTFESLRLFAGNAFHINNIGLVIAPPWAYKLL